MHSLTAKVIFENQAKSEADRFRKSRIINELEKKLDSYFANKSSAKQIRDAMLKLKKARIASSYTPPKTKEAPISPEEQTLAGHLKSIQNLLSELNYTAAQQKQILQVFALILSDNRENIFKNRLLNDKPEGLLFLRKAFENIKIPGNHNKTSAQYRQLVADFQEAGFPGSLFKKEEFGTPDFTSEEFANNETIMQLYQTIVSELGGRAKNIFDNKSTDNPKKALELLNQYILNNEKIFQELITATRKNHHRFPNLSAKLLNIDKEINSQSPEQRNIFRNQIKYRNRLLLEELFPRLCPTNEKIIYKQTLDEFKKYRLLHGKYKTILNMKFAELKDAANKTGIRRQLFQKYWGELQAHAEIIKCFLTDVDVLTSRNNMAAEGLLNQIQTAYFFPPEKTLDSKSKKILEPLVEYESLHGTQSVKLKPNVSEDEFMTVMTDLYAGNFSKKYYRLEQFLWTRLHQEQIAGVYPELSSVRTKSINSITEKIELRSASDLADILKSIPELSKDNLFKQFLKPLGHGKARILLPKGNDSFTLRINALEKNNVRLGDITDTIGMCVTVDNYQDIETVMSCLEYYFKDFILEKENLFAKNSAKKAYHDVKYIIKLNDHILFEVQIKTLYEKVIGELLDHDTLYKNNYNLSAQERKNLEPIVYGLMWARHLQLAEEYRKYYSRATVN